MTSPDLSYLRNKVEDLESMLCGAEEAAAREAQDREKPLQHSLAGA